MQVRDALYIGGSWVPAAGAESIEVVDAATEEVLGTVPCGGAEDVDRAAHAASEAFEDWSQTSVEERSKLLSQVAEAMTARSKEITTIITREVGMPFEIAERAQTGLAITDFASMAKVVSEFHWEETIGNSLVVREPIGVVGAITPWNYPLHQISAKVSGALGAGCTVILKPSDVAPLSAFMLADIFDEIGLPAGVFNLITGPGVVVGEAISSHPLVDMVSFTGSTRAGTRVMQLCAQTIKRVALELGGKSANVILPGTDLDVAIPKGIDDCMRNAGQNCSALTRMIVPRADLARIEELAKAGANTYQAGDPFAPTTKLGPLVSDKQRSTVLSYIDKGIEEGATLISGGPETPEGVDRGYFVKATVFSNVTKDMTIAKEEIFGPVLAIMPYDTEEEAVQIANDSPYGLSGAVWSGDAEHAERIARRMRTGRVSVNGGPFNPIAPFGGYKQSGLGRELGRFGLEEFLEVKSLQR